MKKSLIALVVAGSFVLAGCSSSGGAGSHDGDFIVDRPEPVDPGFGIGTEVDRPQPDMGDTPDWGLDSPVDRPMPDLSPDRPEPDYTPDRPEPADPSFGITPDDVPDRPEPVDPSWGISTDPEVSPAINSIDRNKVRDALRTRLNG